MTSAVNVNKVTRCLVCNKEVKENAIHIHSGLARKNGSIRDQISEIVGKEDVAKACEISEVVCSLCLKLLLNITNVEQELKSLKMEFYSIFRLGVESWKEAKKRRHDSGLVYDDTSKSELGGDENDSKEKPESKFSCCVSDFRMCLSKGNENCFCNGSIAVDSIRESFVDHVSFGEKEASLCIEENVMDSLTESEATCSVIHVSHEGSVVPKNELNQTLQFLKNNVHFQNDISVSDGVTAKNFEKRETENIPESFSSPSAAECLERNLSIDFENFETQLCSTDTVEEELHKESLPSLKRPKRKSIIAGRPIKKRKCLKIQKNKILNVDHSGFDVDWDPGEGIHKECKRDENQRKSCDSCNEKFCKICGRFFSNSSEVAEHRGKVHPDVYKFVCDMCPNIRYRHKSKLTQHFKIQHKMHIHRCPGCDIEEASQNSLDQHIINKHPESRFFKCNLCLKAFRTYRYLHFVHIKRCHEGLPVKYFCDICKKGFVDKASHNNHKYTHSESKKYACKFCGALFHTPYSLKAHVNTHTREKKYTCPVCGASFLRQCNLIGHKKRAHQGHLVCEMCGKLLPTKKDLVRHQAIHHSNEKLVSCKKCSANFQNEKSLEGHLQSQHLHEKVYLCQCGKSFTNLCHCKSVHMKESSQNLTLDTGVVQNFRAIDEEINPEGNVVVITLKECKPSTPYSVETSPHPNEILISSDVAGPQIETTSLSETLTATSEGVELPLLHPHPSFDTIEDGKIGVSAPILITSLNTSTTNAVHPQVISQEIAPSKMESTIAQITSGVNGESFPFHPVPSTTISEDHEALKVLQERTQASQVADTLPPEILGLPDLQSHSSNEVPVTYITAWPT